MVNANYISHSWLAAVILVVLTVVETQSFSMNSTELNMRRQLGDAHCDPTAKNKPEYQAYFRAMQNMYRGREEGTCLPLHMNCGWPSTPSTLPLFVLSIGLEGAGHHLWTEIMEQPVFDCVWINGRHYQRDIADGVPRTTVAMLAEGFREQQRLRSQSGKPACKTIYDAEDSFPTGAIRKSGRVFMRPDLVNLQMLDGVVFNIKYLIIARNVTDTALSALRRNFFSAIDPELRTVEHTLTYVESALRGIPCHKTFIGHYEHVLADPKAFIEPLSTFLELSPKAKTSLTSRLSKAGKRPSRKPHKLTQFTECAGKDESSCYQHVVRLLDGFFEARGFMWPTFAANGFDYSG